MTQETPCPPAPDPLTDPAGEEEMKDFNDRARPPPDHQKELLKIISSLSGRHGAWQVFADFNEAAAISISNAVDLINREKREARYMELIKRYRSDELSLFPKALGELVMALEAEPADIMGKTFHDLELHNKWAGQFFSPINIARMMAKMTLSDKEGIEEKIAQRGFVTASEPACGSGAMVIALALEMREMGINYQQHLHVTAADIDAKCVHMAYLQFSLLHIPAVIVHGNSLSLEEYGHWYTPAHIMGGWDWKLKRAFDGEPRHEIQRPPEPQPVSAARREDEPPPPPMQLTLF